MRTLRYTKQSALDGVVLQQAPLMRQNFPAIEARRRKIARDNLLGL
jgi:hypothetical protein